MVVQAIYLARFGETAARQFEEALPEREREVLSRALISRPAGSDLLASVDDLYLGQLPSLLFAADVSGKRLNANLLNFEI